MAMEVENQATSPAFDDFLQSGRTGRRNALPDIHGENASISTASLPDGLQKLSCSDIQMDSSCSGETPGSSQSAEVGYQCHQEIDLQQQLKHLY